MSTDENAVDPTVRAVIYAASSAVGAAALAFIGKQIESIFDRRRQRKDEYLRTLLWKFDTLIQALSDFHDNIKRLKNDDQIRMDVADAVNKITAVAPTPFVISVFKYVEYISDRNCKATKFDVNEADKLYSEMIIEMRKITAPGEKHDTATFKVHPIGKHPTSAMQSNITTAPSVGGATSSVGGAASAAGQTMTAAQSIVVSQANVSSSTATLSCTTGPPQPVGVPGGSNDPGFPGSAHY